MSANLVDGEGIALGETTPALANKVIELDGSEKVLRSYASTNGLLVIFLATPVRLYSSGRTDIRSYMIIAK